MGWGAYPVRSGCCGVATEPVGAGTVPTLPSVWQRWLSGEKCRGSSKPSRHPGAAGAARPDQPAQTHQPGPTRAGGRGPARTGGRPREAKPAHLPPSPPSFGALFLHLSTGQCSPLRLPAGSLPDLPEGVRSQQAPLRIREPPSSSPAEVQAAPPRSGIWAGTGTCPSQTPSPQSGR